MSNAASNSVSVRLNEFLALKDGWLDGKGKAPSKVGLDWFSATFETQYPDELPFPYVYPTAEGGIQIEWSLAGHEVSLEVSLESRRAHWHNLNLTTHEESSRDLQLTQTDDWAWINSGIKCLAKGRQSPQVRSLSA